MSVLFDISYNMGNVSNISQIAPTFIAVVIFGLTIWTGEELTPGKAFTVLALLNIL